MELKRSLIVVHRWLGVALCLLFLLWFLSGIGMMYWDFPTVTAADRLERSPALTPSTIVLSPTEAYATLGASQLPAAVRLNSFDGRPVYRFRTGRGESLVYADTGEAQRSVSRAMVDRIAAAWTGRPSADARVEDMTAADQWTVQGPLRNERPLWKYSWPNGEQVYVAQTSGDVVQYTTTRSRIGAYVGPVPHWLYFTPLRTHQQAWSRLVIWTSGIGTIGSVLGIVIGVWMYSPSRRYRLSGVPASLPYRGQKWWHAALGLIFGVAAATWAFSGMLSMDPFGDRSRVASVRLLSPIVPLSAFAAQHPREAIEQLRGLDVKELELTSFAGEAVYLATLAHGDTRIVPVAGEPRSAFDAQKIAAIVTAAIRANDGGATGVEIQTLDQYDRYYLDRRRVRPLPVLVATLEDAENTRYYIDPKTARVVGSYSSRTWVSRWLYHGLHSLDLPWLYNHRPAWDLVVIVCMAGGAALSVTSIVLAWRVVTRT